MSHARPGRRPHTPRSPTRAEAGRGCWSDEDAGLQMRLPHPSMRAGRLRSDPRQNTGGLKHEEPQRRGTPRRGAAVPHVRLRGEAPDASSDRAPRPTATPQRHPPSQRSDATSLMNGTSNGRCPCMDTARMCCVSGSNSMSILVGSPLMTGPFRSVSSALLALRAPAPTRRRTRRGRTPSARGTPGTARPGPASLHSRRNCCGRGTARP
jgi:hypothetical protein